MEDKYSKHTHYAGNKGKTRCIRIPRKSGGNAWTGEM